MWRPSPPFPLKSSTIRCLLPRRVTSFEEFIMRTPMLSWNAKASIVWCKDNANLLGLGCPSSASVSLQLWAAFRPTRKPSVSMIDSDGTQDGHADVDDLAILVRRHAQVYRVYTQLLHYKLCCVGLKGPSTF